MNTVSEKQITDYYNYLITNEKSSATVEKYIRDVSFFSSWLGELYLSKESAMAYKKHLSSKLAPASVNAAISSLNSFFEISEEVIAG